MTQINVDKKRNNAVTVVGALKEIERIDMISTKGVPAIRGNAIIEANDNQYKVDFYISKVYNNGKDNPQFEKVKELTLGQMIKVSGNLEGNRFYGRDGKLIITNRITVRFFNDLYETDTPGATFDFTGFVMKELSDKCDEYDAIIGHELIVAQSKYNVDKGIDQITFNVDPNNKAAVNGIRSAYKLNATVRVNGHINSEIITTKVIEEALFGEPKVTTHQTRVVQFVIDGGLQVDPLEVYSDTDITTLVENTEKSDAQMLADSKSKNKPEAAAGFAAPATGKDNNDAMSILFGGK